VFLEQEGLQSILKYDKDKSIQHVFFVSGDSIPIKSAHYVYHLPDLTFLLMDRSAKNAGPFLFAGGIQWKAYSREDMEYIATFPLKE
jgi:hypothetical protein